MASGNKTKAKYAGQPVIAKFVELEGGPKAGMRPVPLMPDGTLANAVCYPISGVLAEQYLYDMLSKTYKHVGVWDVQKGEKAR
jgi:hypothetical protein